ncbi:MAG TPA: protein translocase subunit SecDF, partial [Bacteroidales bacterium]|nr:protein translocase subunit SecDF [Bacteroidales bacterium]
MRNKGAILTLAIALALVCIYQLAFTFKAVSVRNEAVEYATDPVTNTIDEKRQQYFLDSVTNEKVFFGMFTYQQCIERELNFGLDLKGGMNIILEISVTDVIRNLSSSPTDTTLNRALALAKQEQLNSSRDFIDLFGEQFSLIAPNASLESLFRTKELSSRIPFGSSNEDVIKVLREESQGAIDNAFNIIRTRIDQFGVAQPNIQKLETAGRVLVDLPGVKDRDRVRRLLQGTANLEFWQTYESAELQQGLLEVNEVVRNYLEAEKVLSEAAEAEVAETPAVEAEEPLAEEASEITSEEDDLLSMVEGESAEGGDSIPEDIAVAYPFFQIFQPNIDRNTGQPYQGSAIGYAHFKDTGRVNLYMAMAMERNLFPRDVKFLWANKAIADNEKKPTNYFQLYAIKAAGRDGKAPLDGDAITSARQEFDEANSSAYVSMSMNAEGAQTWARLTAQNIGRQIAIVMDNRVFSAPVVQNEIKGGNSSITGNFSVNEAIDLANLLKSGKLPAPARIIQETVVGPSLGHKAVQSGSSSFAIAFVVILLYMIFYYSRNAGLVADIALLVNMFFIVGVLASLGAALTLPGIAGIVLTIGMSVDANVLIYERIREELRAGKGLKMAVKDGYKNALSAIIDANLTTLITAIILLIFGTGPIKGFATTLVIGILTSLFTAIFITRLIIESQLDGKKEFTFSTKTTEGFFKNAKVKFLESRKLSYGISGIVLVISLVSIFGIRGLDLGVDFTGGRNYIIQFDEPTDNQLIADALAAEFGEEPKVITYGSADQVRITTSYMINEEGVEVDDKIQEQIFTALQPLIGGEVDYETFFESGKYWQGSQKVGATIADDIKRNSLIVFGVALVFMFIYIFLRFRNWQFGLGAVAALVHDSIIVLGLFSVLYGLLPFSLEIDQAFIAAILTVVGYSINDTVVVYDRIREFLMLYPKRERREIINMALNSTLSRTFNTSISTFVVLLTIFILGGEAIQG